MRKKIHINETELTNGTLYLHTLDSIDTLQEVGQLIADSEAFAFVYLLEDSEEYVYVYLEESTWTSLKELLTNKDKVYLKNNENHLELKHFYDELDYLISNIEGNGNYGEEMVSKVESVFIK